MRIFCGIFLLGMLLTSGCTVIQELPVSKALPDPASPEQVLCRKLLEAFLKNDADAFVNHLPEDRRAAFDVRKFDQTRTYIVEKMGQPISYQYLTTLEFVTFSPHIWKIRFERKDSKNNPIRSEALFRIVTGRTGKNEVVVIGFNFL